MSIDVCNMVSEEEGEREITLDGWWKEPENISKIFICVSVITRRRSTV